MSRKERDDKRKSEEILDAALEIFSEKGFHSTTMAQISSASEYPLGTIYKYFSGKKQMYHEMVIHRVHDLGQILFEISQDTTIGVSERLQMILMAQAKFYKTNRHVARIYISERSSIDAVAMPKLNEKVNKLHEKMVTLFEDLFVQGVSQGDFKSYPSRDLADLFSDIVHSAAWACLFKDETDDEMNQRLSLIFEMFTTGILIK
jgi:AcrR family transcriptional regulator